MFRNRDYINHIHLIKKIMPVNKIVFPAGNDFG